MADPNDRSPLDELASRLSKARTDAGLPDPDAPPAPEPTPRGAAMGIAFRLGTDLVAAVLVGSVIGYGLDLWMGTLPLMFLVFFALGTAAGIVNVFRTARAMNEGDAQPPASPGDDAS